MCTVGSLKLQTNYFGVSVNPPSPPTLSEPDTSRATGAGSLSLLSNTNSICCTDSVLLSTPLTRLKLRLSSFPGLSSFQESVAMDRIQRIMGVLQNPFMG